MDRKPRPFKKKLKKYTETLKILLILFLMKIRAAGAVEKMIRGTGLFCAWFSKFIRERAIALSLLLVSIAGLLILRTRAYGTRWMTTYSTGTIRAFLLSLSCVKRPAFSVPGPWPGSWTIMSGEECR